MTAEEKEKAKEVLDKLLDMIKDTDERPKFIAHTDGTIEQIIEPCEDCITLRLKKGTLKYSDKDYVVYKKEWLKKWWQPELALLGIELPSIQPINPNIKALGEELRTFRGGIKDEKVLTGFNMAISLCNKHLADMRGEE